jgi:carboxyl-terminal processing protease
MQTKTNRMKLAINPRKPKFDKPVAVLVDECSVSCAELFPGGLQELKAARIFGSRTAGQVIPAQVVKLPTGDGFLHAIAGLESASGYVWEGNGVQPDEPVAQTRKLLQQDSDPVLTAALNWIASQTDK